MNKIIHKVYVDSADNIVTVPRVKPNIDHLVVQLNTRGHVHKDKKKEIPRKQKYRNKDGE